MNVQPYLMFDGRCEEAIEFYRRTVDAELLTLMRHSDAPEPPPPGMLPPGSERKIMHASFRIGSSEIMASDGHCLQQTRFEGISLSLTVDTRETAQHHFSALADGGEIVQPLIQTFFSPAFGMIRDRFGVSWMIVATA